MSVQCKLLLLLMSILVYVDAEPSFEKYFESAVNKIKNGELKSAIEDLEKAIKIERNKASFNKDEIIKAHRLMETCFNKLGNLTSAAKWHEEDWELRNKDFFVEKSELINKHLNEKQKNELWNQKDGKPYAFKAESVDDIYYTNTWEELDYKIQRAIINLWYSTNKFPQGNLNFVKYHELLIIEDSKGRDFVIDSATTLDFYENSPFPIVTFTLSNSSTKSIHINKLDISILNISILAGSIGSSKMEDAPMWDVKFSYKEKDLEYPFLLKKGTFSFESDASNWITILPNKKRKVNVRISCRSGDEWISPLVIANYDVRIRFSTIDGLEAISEESLNFGF